jgi:hypothetical protein
MIDLLPVGLSPAELDAGAPTREFIVNWVRRCIDAGIIGGDQTDIAHELLALAQGLAMQEAAGRSRRRAECGPSISAFRFLLFQV